MAQIPLCWHAHHTVIGYPHSLDYFSARVGHAGINGSHTRNARRPRPLASGLSSGGMPRPTRGLVGGVEEISRSGDITPAATGGF